MKKIFLIILSYWVLLSTLNAQSPIAAYHFNNGTYVNAADSKYQLKTLGEVISVSDVNGVSNSAVQFSQEGALEGDIFDSSEFDSGITLSSWVYVESVDFWIGLINNFSITNLSGFYLGVNPTNNSVRFNLGFGLVEDTTPITFNEWIHFAATFDGTTLKLYRNGVLVIEEFVTGTITQSDNPFRIGCQSENAFGTSLNGSMDEILIYNEALSELDILNLYSNGTSTLANDIGMVSLGNKIFTNSNNEVTGTIFNHGAENLTSFDLHYTIGQDTFSQAFSGMDIASKESYDFSHLNPLLITIGETEELVVWANNPNGTIDSNTGNNQILTTVLGADFVAEKRVLIEEGTATWCQPCPRGIAGVNHVAESYPNSLVAIAFHEDIMAITDHDANFEAFPSIRVDRGQTALDILLEDVAPIGLESRVLTKLENFPIASIAQIVSYNPSTREITAQVSSNFAIPLQGDLRFSLVITEDGVTGIGADFEQANLYSGTNIPIGGFESLPNPVPADQMIYDHVARAVIGDYEGISGSLPNNVMIGENYDYTFNYTLPIEYDENEIKIIAILHNFDEDIVINSVSNALSEAIITSNENVFSSDEIVRVFPNPAEGWTQVQLDLNSLKKVSLKLFDCIGQEIMNKNYGELSGEMILPINTQHLDEGIYVVNILIGKEMVTKKLIVSR